MSARGTSPNHHRSRWAALGAAVAVTLGAGGLSFVDAAAGSGERATFTAIPSCRVADTRPDFQVGDRGAPLGADDTHTITVRGDVGRCVGLPADAVAASLNVTAVGATAPTFLTFWPGGTRPDASSLNPAPGQPPTPNAVTVDLSDDGTFDVYNFQGSVDVIVDVVGYYRDHHHDDRYYSKSQVDDALDAAAVTVEVLSDEIDDLGIAIADKADATAVYSKGEVNAKLPTTLAVVTDSSAYYDFNYVAEAVSADDLAIFQTPGPGVVDVELRIENAVVTCSAGSDRILFLLIDDIPVPSSAYLKRDAGAITTELRGITSVGQGQHSIEVGAECRASATATFPGMSAYFRSNIVFFPS